MGAGHEVTPGHVVIRTRPSRAFDQDASEPGLRPCVPVARSGTRMGQSKGGLQAFIGHMGVDLRGRQRFVAKHFLHRSKIRPAFEQMGRHGVSQTMRTKVGGILIETKVGVDDAAHHPRIDPSTTHPQYCLLYTSPSPRD